MTEEGLRHEIGVASRGRGPRAFVIDAGWFQRRRRPGLVDRQLGDWK